MLPAVSPCWCDPHKAVAVPMVSPHLVGLRVVSPSDPVLCLTSGSCLLEQPVGSAGGMSCCTRGCCFCFLVQDVAGEALCPGEGLALQRAALSLSMLGSPRCPAEAVSPLPAVRGHTTCF